MSNGKEKLSKIKSGGLSRGFALAKLSVSAGAKAASHAIGSVFASEESKSDRLNELLRSQMSLLAKELGKLKGSVMKIGQMISIYGENVLPPEANAILKNLQSDSPPLEWEAIEKVLMRQLGADKLAELEIDPEPAASASMGQVHRAVRKSDGRTLAMKIQYPGVDQAIESDLSALKRILSVSKLVPSGPRFDGIFKEVRQMLHQEVDYARELEETNEFRRLLSGDPRFVVPETFPEYSTNRVITTSFEMGLKVDDPKVLGLSQERRNAIGLAALDLYFKELFELKKMQTDPHFGNYRVRLSEDPSFPDQLILFDFGAVRKFPRRFLDPYYEMLRGAFLQDQELLIAGASALEFMREDDTAELKRKFAELCFLIAEPFADPSSTRAASIPLRTDLFDAEGRYDWGSSDLLQRVKKKGVEMAFSSALRPPPREVVFLDRKMGGMFIFLSVLKVRVRGRDLLQKYLSAL